MATKLRYITRSLGCCSYNHCTIFYIHPPIKTDMEPEKQLGEENFRLQNQHVHVPAARNFRGAYWHTHIPKSVPCETLGACGHLHTWNPKRAFFAGKLILDIMGSNLPKHVCLLCNRYYIYIPIFFFGGSASMNKCPSMSRNHLFTLAPIFLKNSTTSSRTVPQHPICQVSQQYVYKLHSPELTVRPLKTDDWKMRISFWDGLFSGASC